MQILLIFLIILKQFGTIPTPPYLIEQPPLEIIFDPRRQVELPCVARGDPQINNYTWTKDQKLYDPSAQKNRVSLRPTTGTLIITEPRDVDEGFYQCSASNQYGTAFSLIVNLRKAEFTTQTHRRIISKSVSVGQSLILPCVKPKGLPVPIIYWTIEGPNGIDRRVPYSNRISQDLKGYLYFSSIDEMDDTRRTNSTYSCKSHFQLLEAQVNGPRYSLKVGMGTPLQKRPRLQNNIERKRFFLVGQEMRLKCIFSGYPTPRVQWRKLEGGDSRLPRDNRLTIDSFGQELIISQTKKSDTGIYECRGENTVGDDQAMIEVNVRSAPFWINKPTSQNIAIGDDTEFNCRAGGDPKPQYRWYKNGRKLKNSDRKYLISETKLIIMDAVEDLDAAVFQCNASNEYGYVFENFYLNVLNQKPDIVNKPPLLTKLVSGQNINITCNVFGAPTPQISWRKDGQSITGGRFKIRHDGMLTINNVSPADEGLWTCFAENRFGSVSASGHILVRKETRIEIRPQNQEKVEGSRAIFRCSAVADDSMNVRIDWLKDNQPIKYHGRIQKDVDDRNTLIILDTQYNDGGTYTCVAKTDLDIDKASATLVVQARPDPPTNLILKCERGEEYRPEPRATLTWQPGGDNNARILSYLVAYNTSFSPEWILVQVELIDDVYNNASSDGSKMNSNAAYSSSQIKRYKTHLIPSQRTTLTIQLNCWVNYTFRVFARNKLGNSDASEISPICSTRMCQPKRNPRNVIGYGTANNRFVIKWDVIPMIEWSAPTFRYEVQYKLVEDKRWKSINILNPLNTSIVIRDIEPNKKIEYRVKSVNQLDNQQGTSDATDDLITYEGYSGVGRPSVRVEIIEQVVSDRSIELRWKEINDLNEIRGRLRGFKFIYTEEELYKEYQQSYTTSRDIYHLHDVYNNETRTIINNLISNTTYRLFAIVYNDIYGSDESEHLIFTTLPGRASSVNDLIGHPYGLTGVRLSWKHPNDLEREELFGYRITYQMVNGIREPKGALIQYNRLIHPSTTNVLIGGLKQNVNYRFYVTPLSGNDGTINGFDEMIEVKVGDMEMRNEMNQLNLNYNKPSTPDITLVSKDMNSVIIEWKPERMLLISSIFFVQYRIKGQSPWQKTENIVQGKRAHIRNLQSATIYEFRVVSTTGQLTDGVSDGETASKIISIRLLGRSQMSQRYGQYNWVISFVIIILFLLILLIVHVISLNFGYCTDDVTDYYLDKKLVRLFTAKNIYNDGIDEKMIDENQSMTIPPDANWPEQQQQQQHDHGNRYHQRNEGDYVPSRHINENEENEEENVSNKYFSDFGTTV
ncbi:hypothetical protein SNEBB_009539 [Seison nebaliae]|nr:hypothetical protein SNEBB_009539 [Seison nebaliae]